MSNKYFPYFCPPKTKWTPLGKLSTRSNSFEPSKMQISAKTKPLSRESDSNCSFSVSPLKPKNDQCVSYSIDSSQNPNELQLFLQTPRQDDFQSEASFQKVNDSRNNLLKNDNFEYKTKLSHSKRSFLCENSIYSLMRKLEPKPIKFLYESPYTTRSLSAKKRVIKYYSSKEVNKEKEPYYRGPIIVGSMIKGKESIKAKLERRKRFPRTSSNANTTTEESYYTLIESSISKFA
ncbi:unnamed protein product [Blepharisma stoltei]|uniref:Uncharacterized protein n=1 Tax=Blepharisma stoltei TaxID=1481888 RepID=A0AAU9JFF7_9CILI|nr:unnamed protein product [Blepharisma stoltei]